MTNQTFQFDFEVAVREKAKLRMAIDGPAKSGKTFTSLLIATYLVPDGKIIMLDTEHNSGLKYAPVPGTAATPDEGTFNFLHANLPDYSPAAYIAGIHAAEEAGADVIVVDSFTYAWKNILEQKNSLDLRGVNGDKRYANSWTNWGFLTVQQEELIETVLQSSCHIIATMRSKMAYEQIKDDQTNKLKVVKLGLEPIQREGTEYEFDVMLDMNQEHFGTISGTRCHELEGYGALNPGQEVAEILGAWLQTGVEPAERPMRREVFVAQMGALGYVDDAQIKGILGELKLLSISGPRKYNVMLEAVMRHVEETKSHE